MLDNADELRVLADQKKVSGRRGRVRCVRYRSRRRRGVAQGGLDRWPGGRSRSHAKSGHQIFDEVWRRYRDFFYVKNMHGYDWQALHDQYKPLVQYVRIALI